MTCIPRAFAESLTTESLIFPVVAIGLELAFEFTTGFHETANAVATIIYTQTLPHSIAVTWSRLCNLTGVRIARQA